MTTPSESPLPAAAPVSRAPMRQALWIVLLGALLYLPSFARAELDDEEGRRALTARDMVESGGWIVPTIWGQPYLSKPPGFPWAIALASTVTGGVDVAATRLPSVVATILTALGLYLFGRSRARPRAGAIAGLLFLVSFAAWEKGAFGELEAVFALCVFAAVALLAASWRAGGLWAVAAGTGLGAALLVKGPPALVFLVAGIAGLAWAERRLAVVVSPRVLGPVALGLLLAAAWVGLLLLEISPAVALGRWRDEISRAGAPTLAAFLRDRERLVLGVFLGFLPSSLVCVLACRSGPRWLREPSMRLAAGFIVVSVAFFLAYRGTRTRYLYPVLPWCCLAAGLVLDTATSGVAERLRARLRRASLVLFALFAVATGAAVVACFRPIEGVRVEGAVGIALVVAAAATIVAGARATWTRPRSTAFLLAVLAFLACVRLLQLTQVVPQTGARRGIVAMADAVEELVPASEPVVLLHLTTDHNPLFYVDRPFRWMDDLASAAPGRMVLVDADVAAGVPEIAARWEVLGEVRLEERTALVARVR